MTDHRQVMQQALDALEEAVTYTSSPTWSPSMTNECLDAIESLRQALAAPQAEGTAFNAYREATGKGLNHEAATDEAAAELLRLSAENAALRDALRRVKHKAVSLADAQVIALEALSGTAPARTGDAA